MATNTSNAADTIKATRRNGMFWGLDLHSWEHAMLGSLAFAAIAAAFVLVTTGAVVYLQRQAVRESDERIAEANAKGKEAKEGAAKANERARSLEVHAEELRKKNIALEQAIAPRRLTAKQSQDISAALIPFGGQIVKVRSYILDAESAALGQQIVDILHHAKIGVQDKRLSEGAFGSVNWGIFVSGDNKALVDALLKCFTTIGNLNPARGVVPQSAGITMESAGPTAAATIFIGVKPNKQ